MRDRVLLLPVGAASRLGVRPAWSGGEPSVRADGQGGQQVACVNPAALGGGAGDLDPYLLTVTQTGLRSAPSTPWVAYPGLYSASCQHGGGASWLQVTSLAGANETRPVVNDDAGIPGSAPAWGHHDYEFGPAIGNLLHDVVGEESAWEARH